MRKLFLVAAILLLPGCVSHDTYLFNGKGQRANCHVVGWGIGGTIISEITYNNCLKKYQQAGFIEK